MVAQKKTYKLNNDFNAEDPRFNRFQVIIKDLRIIFRASQAHAKWVEKECGLSSAQLWMMWELFNTPGLKVSELANILSIHASTCSNMLDKLQNKGFIRRDRNNPKDQRVVELNLTDEGVQLLASAPRPAQGVLADVLLRLPDDTLDQLENGLKEFVKILKSSNSEDGFKPIDL